MPRQIASRATCMLRDRAAREAAASVPRAGRVDRHVGKRCHFSADYVDYIHKSDNGVPAVLRRRRLYNSLPFVQLDYSNHGTGFESGRD